MNQAIQPKKCATRAMAIKPYTASRIQKYWNYRPSAYHEEFSLFLCSMQEPWKSSKYCSKYFCKSSQGLSPTTKAAIDAKVRMIVNVPQNQYPTNNPDGTKTGSITFRGVYSKLFCLTTGLELVAEKPINCYCHICEKSLMFNYSKEWV